MYDCSRFGGGGGIFIQGIFMYFFHVLFWTFFLEVRLLDFIFAFFFPEFSFAKNQKSQKENPPKKNSKILDIPHVYSGSFSGGGQHLEQPNKERPIFENFEILNIKRTKDEVFDFFISDFLLNCIFVKIIQTLKIYWVISEIWQFSEL